VFDGKNVAIGEVHFEWAKWGAAAHFFQVVQFHTGAVSYSERFAIN
jgi:hypothetical protein